MKIIQRFMVLLSLSLLLFNSASAQSKKEFKKMAKIQEEIDATTNADGLRFFNDKSKHLNFFVKRCYHLDETVIVEIMVENSNENDDYLKLYGLGSEYEYTIGATDDNNTNYWSKYFSYAIGNSNDYNEYLNEVLIPAEGLLKLKLKIKVEDSELPKFNELYFGYKSALESTQFTRQAKIKGLMITK